MTSNYNFTNETLSIEFYGSICIGSLGLLTNALNLIVSLRKTVRTTRMGFYVLFVSIFNILAIAAAILDFFPQSIGQKEFVLTSTYACVCIQYFSRVFIQLSQWLNVMISFDRLSLLKYRARQDQRSLNTKRLLLIVLTLVAVICGVNSANLFYQVEYTMDNDDDNNNATTNSTTSLEAQCIASDAFDWTRDIVHILSRSVLPIIFQTVLNGKVIYTLLETRNLITNEISTNREKRYATVLAFYTLFIILTEVIYAPSTIFLNLYGNNNDNYIQTPSNQTAIAALAYLCSSIFGVFIICDLSFFLNLTNKKFRDETKKFFFLPKILY